MKKRDRKEPQLLLKKLEEPDRKDLLVAKLRVDSAASDLRMLQAQVELVIAKHAGARAAFEKLRDATWKKYALGQADLINEDTGEIIRKAELEAQKAQTESPAK